MYSWRITKYDPKNRDENGFYQKDEWISLYDIGRKYHDVEFTLEEYLFYENAYIDAVIRIMDGNNAEFLRIEALAEKKTFKKEGMKRFGYIENADLNEPEVKERYDSLENNMLVSKQDIALIVRFVLREITWCKLVSDQMYVHFGYDYYMFIGSEKPLHEALDAIEENGLFVEAMESPYM